MEVNSRGDDFRSENGRFRRAPTFDSNRHRFGIRERNIIMYKSYFI